MSPRMQLAKLAMGGLSLVLLLAMQLVAVGDEPRFPAIRRGKVFVRLDPQALAELQQKTFAHQSLVSDVILGTSIQGQCKTVGTAQIVPQEQQGFELVVTGNSVTTSFGENGPATIHSTTTTDFVATSPITFTREHGFEAGAVTVNARTRMKTNDIETVQRGLVGRIVRGVAERRVEEARPVATEIARRKTSARIEHAIASQLEKKLAKVNDSLDTLKKTVALLDPDLTQDACLIVSKDQLLLCFRGDEIDHAAISRELPKMTTNSELWVHRSAVKPDLQARIAALSVVRDAAGVVVNSANKIIEAKSVVPVSKTDVVAKAIAEPLLDQQGDWYVVRVPNALAESRSEPASK